MIDLCNRAQESFSKIVPRWLAKYGDTDVTRFVINRYLHTMRRKSKNSGVKREMTFDYLMSVWNTTCPILKIPLDIYAKVTHDGYPTLDKVVPELGYVDGNVRWVSRRGNMYKSDNTLETLGLITSYVASHLRSTPNLPHSE